MPEPTPVKIFANEKEAEAAIGQFFRTTWRSEKNPKTHYPLQLKQVVGPAPGSRFFLKTLMIASNMEYELNLGYPLVPISEEEAIKLADQFRQASLRDKESLSSSGPTNISRNEATQPIPKKEVIMAKKAIAETEVKAEVKAPTPYRIIRQGLEGGADKAHVLEQVKTVFPTEEVKKLRQMVHSIAAQLKHKENGHEEEKK